MKEFDIFLIIYFLFVAVANDNQDTIITSGIMLRSQRCLDDIYSSNLVSSSLLQKQHLVGNEKDVIDETLNSSLMLNGNAYKQRRNVQNCHFEDNNCVSKLHRKSVSGISSNTLPTDEEILVGTTGQDVTDRPKDISVGISLKCVLPVKDDPKKTGGLKLTLRMKRSSCLDEVIQSDRSLIHDYLEPEYEVFKVEGIPKHPRITYSQRKKRSKYKYIKLDGEHKRNKGKDLSQRPVKRLRLILGNESHTIHFPSTVTNWRN